MSESDWPSVAVDALEAGFDGPSLRRLTAVKNPTHWEISKYIGSALSELGVKPQSTTDAFDWCAKEICSEIVQNTRDPFKGAGEIWRDMLRLGYFPKALDSLFTEIEMEGTGMLPGGYEEARSRIIQHARNYLAGFARVP